MHSETMINAREWQDMTYKYQSLKNHCVIIYSCEVCFTPANAMLTAKRAFEEFHRNTNAIAIVRNGVIVAQKRKAS